jgi:aspartyl-tRNA(Asn)/glutamyl-tRNA(Gln) amidotransferase subunit C
MAISKDEVKYIAHLARIGLTDVEIEHFQKQLESILGYVDKLKKLDGTEGKPMAHVFDVKNVYRADEIKPSIDSAKVLKIAPVSQGNFYKVPKVIE